MRIFSWNVSDVSFLFPEYSLNFDPHCVLQEPLRSGNIFCSKQSDTEASISRVERKPGNF
jgi:hypothetical protein